MRQIDERAAYPGVGAAVFLGHKAAAFVYQRRLHTISVFVFADAAGAAGDHGAGFHVIAWAAGGFGMALVSDVGWDDLRALEARLRG